MTFYRTDCFTRRFRLLFGRHWVRISARTLAILLFSWFYLVTTGKYGILSRLCRDRFLPNPFQFNIHRHPTIRRYTLSILKASFCNAKHHGCVHRDYVLMNMPPYSLIDINVSEEPVTHLQGKNLIMKMEAAGSSETVVTVYNTMTRHTEQIC
jgi:hypothetical protein